MLRWVHASTARTTTGSARTTTWSTRRSVHRARGGTPTVTGGSDSSDRSPPAAGWSSSTRSWCTVGTGRSLVGGQGWWGDVCRTVAAPDVFIGGAEGPLERSAPWQGGSGSVGPLSGYEGTHPSDAGAVGTTAVRHPMSAAVCK